MGRLLFSLSSLSFVGYAIGFVNQIIIANKFGTSAELDVYLLALSVVNFGWFFIGPINEISVPDFFKEIKKSSHDGSEYFSKVLNIILLFSFTLSLLIYVYLPNIFNYVSSGMIINYSQFKENILFLLPIIFLTAITQFFQAVLNSMSKYIAQSIGKVVTASLSVIFLLLFFDYFGIKAIIFGVELGLIILAVLQFYFIFKLNIYYKPFSSIISEIGYYKHISALSFMYLLSAIQLVYERFVFMSFGDGVLSSYNYSQALMQVPQMIVVTGVVAIVWTNFMNKIHENEIDKGLDELFNIALNSFIIAMFVAVTISIFSKEIVYILFYRGEFDMNSLEKVSFNLKYLIYGVPFLILNSLVLRAFYSLKLINEVLILSIYISFMTFILLFIAFQINSIIIALLILVITQSIGVIYKFVILYKKFKYINKEIILNISLSLLVLALLASIDDNSSAVLNYTKTFYAFKVLIMLALTIVLSIIYIKVVEYFTKRRNE